MVAQTEEIERVVIIGAGAAGAAAAVDLARRDYRVALYDISPRPILSFSRIGGVEYEGNLGEGFIKIPILTTDISLAMKDAQLIMSVIPAHSQRNLIRVLLPHIKSDQILLLTTGSAGSLEIGETLIKAGFNLNSLLLGECVVAPLSARMINDTRVRIRLSSSGSPKKLRFSAFPGRNTMALVENLQEMFFWLPKPNVFEVGLNNPNFLIHPAPMLLNYAAVERADGKFSIMNEGMTQGVLRALDAVDAEKMALQRALGLEVISIDDFYRETGIGPQVYREKGDPFGLHDRVWDRYISEDVPFGIVMFSSLGRMLRVPTPVCDSIVNILSAVKQTDYWAEGRTVKSLGINGLDRWQIKHYLETGEKTASR
jgi:opine dehydrogenase